MGRVFYVVHVQDPLVEAYLDGIRYLTNPFEKGRAHVTARGPYTRRVHMPKVQAKIAGSVLNFAGVGTFFGPTQHTVFLRCDSEALQAVWHKPDFKGYHPHLTLFDGKGEGARQIAEDLLAALEERAPCFSTPVSGLDPLHSTKGQSNLDLSSAWGRNRERLARALGRDLPALQVKELPWSERRGLMDSLCVGLAQLTPVK